MEALAVMPSALLVLLVVVLVTGVSAFVFGVAALPTARIFARPGRRQPVDSTRTENLTERVRAVGRLVGLEVRAKEIATVTKGCSWLPPMLLSQARLAMIFHFENQYAVDLGAISPGDVRRDTDGVLTIRMPEIQGSLRLTDVTPYDIQDGRVLGLLDVIQMNAKTQEELMRRAQDQAADLFSANDKRYAVEARQSIERHLRSLLGMLGVEARFEWPQLAERVEGPPRQLIAEAASSIEAASVRLSPQPLLMPAAG